MTRVVMHRATGFSGHAWSLAAGSGNAPPPSPAHLGVLFDSRTERENG